MQGSNHGIWDVNILWTVTGSIPPLGSIAGSLVSGFFLTVLGRRGTLIMISVPFCLGFLLIGFAVHPSMLLIGRFIGGFMIGFCPPSAQIYVSFTLDESWVGMDFLMMLLWRPDWWMCFTSRARSVGFFHGHLSGAGRSGGLRYRSLHRVGRAGLDSRRLPHPSVRMHVVHAWNSAVASVQRPRGRGQEIASVFERKVCSNYSMQLFPVPQSIFSRRASMTISK